MMHAIAVAPGESDDHDPRLPHPMFPRSDDQPESRRIFYIRLFRKRSAHGPEEPCPIRFLASDSRELGWSYFTDRFGGGYYRAEATTSKHKKQAYTGGSPSRWFYFPGPSKPFPSAAEPTTSASATPSGFSEFLAALRAEREHAAAQLAAEREHAAAQLAAERARAQHAETQLMDLLSRQHTIGITYAKDLIEMARSLQKLGRASTRETLEVVEVITRLRNARNTRTTDGNDTGLVNALAEAMKSTSEQSAAAPSVVPEMTASDLPPGMVPIQVRDGRVFLVPLEWLAKNIQLPEPPNAAAPSVAPPPRIEPAPPPLESSAAPPRVKRARRAAPPPSPEPARAEAPSVTAAPPPRIEPAPPPLAAEKAAGAPERAEEAPAAREEPRELRAEPPAAEEAAAAPELAEVPAGCENEAPCDLPEEPAQACESEAPCDEEPTNEPRAREIHAPPMVDPPGMISVRTVRGWLMTPKAWLGPTAPQSSRTRLARLLEPRAVRPEQADVVHDPQ